MDTTQQPPAGGLGISAAAQMLEGILASEDGNEETTSSQEADTNQSPPIEETDEGEVAAEASEETEGDEPDPDVEATDDDEEAPNVTLSDDTLITVKINGKEEQIPLAELKNGHLRMSDYTRKTQEVAEQRKALEGDLQSVKQEREYYSKVLPALEAEYKALQSQEPDWDELYRVDPIEAARQERAWRVRADRLNAMTVEQERVKQQKEQERQKELADDVAKERQILFEENPQWRDSKKWNADLQRMVSYAKGKGYSDEDLAQVYDRRMIGILNDAASYRELMSKKPQPVQGKAPKSAPAGSSSTAPTPHTEVKRAKQRLAKTGRVADAAALFENFLG